MNEGINRTRAANLRKASELKKLGFATGVHALPSKVKSETDRLLLTGTSIRETLRLISGQFPDTKLPSVNALNNYKRKYLGVEMTKDIHDNVVGLNQTETEVLIEKLKKSVGEFYLYLADTILPKLGEGLKSGLEKEELVKMPIKANSERTLAIAKLVGEMNSFARGSGINVLTYEKKTSSLTSDCDEPVSTIPDIYDRLAKLLNQKHGFTIVQQQERSVVLGQN